MATKRTANKKPAPTKKQEAANRYVASIVLFAAAILMFCIAVVEGEVVWKFLHEAWLGITGFAAYVWPAVMLYTAILLAMDKDRSAVARCSISAGILLLTLQALVDVFMHDGTESGLWD